MAQRRTAHSSAHGAQRLPLHHRRARLRRLHRARCLDTAAGRKLRRRLKVRGQAEATSERADADGASVVRSEVGGDVVKWPSGRQALLGAARERQHGRAAQRRAVRQHCTQGGGPAVSQVGCARLRRLLPARACVVPVPYRHRYPALSRTVLLVLHCRHGPHRHAWHCRLRRRAAGSSCGRGGGGRRVRPDSERRLHPAEASGQRLVRMRACRSRPPAAAGSSTRQTANSPAQPEAGCSHRCAPELGLTLRQSPGKRPALQPHAGVPNPERPPCSGPPPRAQPSSTCPKQGTVAIAAT